MGRPRFTDKATLFAWLAAQPAGVNPIHPLYPIGSAGDDSSRIAHWGRNAAGVIVPYGEILLSKVSTELSIGSTSAADVQVLAGSAQFSSGLYVQNGAAALRLLTPHATKWRIQATVAYTDASPADGSLLGLGQYWSAIKSYGGGRARISGAYKYACFSGSPTACTVGTANETPGAGLELIVERTYIQPFGEYTALTEMHASLGKGASANHAANNVSPVAPLIVARPAAAETVGILITKIELK